MNADWTAMFVVSSGWVGQRGTTGQRNKMGRRGGGRGGCRAAGQILLI